MTRVRAKVIAVLRWAGGTRPLLPLTARMLCARLVNESLLFFARELRRPAGARAYTLRANGATINLRHRAGDSATLAEVFYRSDYEPPQDVVEAIGEPLRILDLGANIGLFGAFALPRWPGAEVVAYEPDPDNASVHARTITANHAAARWRLITAAAGNREGEVELAAGMAMGSHIAAAGDTPASDTVTVELRDVLDEVGGADLVKCDIEGGEWAVLLDPRFARLPPRAIVREYHPPMCPEPDPRAAAARALAAAGLQVAPIWHRADGYGMLWGWRG